MPRDISHRPLDNIILVGMPGVGKSTTGVLLAKGTAKDYIDTDLVIQNFTCEPLKDTIERIGAIGFRTLEERCILWCEHRNCVMATGGSVIYSGVAMEHLGSNGIFVHLSMEYEGLRRRLDNLAGRGVLMETGQDLADLYAERMPLYEKWADITVCCDSLSPAAVVARIVASLNGTHLQSCSNPPGELRLC